MDDTTNVCYTRKGVSDILELSVENFKDEVGLTPVQIIDLKALMGDKSDNIPGVAGIGEKSAYHLLEEYQTLDGVYAHLDEIKGALNKKLPKIRKRVFFPTSRYNRYRSPDRSDLGRLYFKNAFFAYGTRKVCRTRFPKHDFSFDF